MNVSLLQHFVNIIPAKLRAISDVEFSHKPSPEKWSKKEIIGHLIDSATNNHQRFVRVQFEDVPYIRYDQNNWNAASRYQEMDGNHVISFWASYNQHLIEVIKRIPEAALQRECNTGGEKNVTLGWLIEDYVKHLEHHLLQVFAQNTDYDFICQLDFKRSDEGGRTTPAFSGYRPQVRFPFEKNTTSGHQFFLNRVIVLPGDSVIAAIKMLSPHFFENRLDTGMEFSLTEGRTVVATGTIMEVVNKTLQLK